MKAVSTKPACGVSKNRQPFNAKTTDNVKKTLTILALTLTTVLALTSCKKDRELRSMNFNATIERLGNDGSKVLLADEHWTYWQIGDQISIASDLSTPGDESFGDLVNSSAGTDFDGYNGVFLANVPDGSHYFLGLFPRNDGNVINPEGENSKGFSATINLERRQPLTSDTSFASKVFPMVAWYGGNMYDAPDYEPANLDFHSLASILRLQIFSTDGNMHVIDSINLTSNHQLHGKFEVENYRTADPYLYGIENTKKTITLYCRNNPTLATLGPESLRTFYVVIPATKTRNDSVRHSFSLTVWDTAGNHCSADFTANMRRNGITYLQALNIHTWVASGATGEGSASAGLVGNGTASRPFKIYTVDDLNYLRIQFHNPVAGQVRINNQVVTSNTHFRIMTSTITLNNDNWKDYGIENFTGIMTYGASNGSNPGITNNSSVPLFNSINNGGRVEGLSVKRGSINTAPTRNWSPFCTTNNGIISNCRLRSSESDPIQFTANYGFAGICVTNNGTVTGSGCEAAVSASNSFAGICHINNGTIRGCYFGSPAAVYSASSAAGICYTNNGSVYDSYFAGRISSSSTNWGGIVYQNEGRVEHCYASSDGLIITTGSVGAIVNTQATISAVVNYCYSDISLRGSTIGSIVANLSNGKVLNSFVNDNLVVLTVSAASHVAGGLVGSMSGGTVANSYAYFNHMARINGEGLAGGLIGRHTGGTVTNCYAYESTTTTRLFYGDPASSTANLNNCYLVGADQTGVTNQSTSALIGGGDDQLLSLLNSNRSTMAASYTGADTLRIWRSDGTVPAFYPYTSN